MRGIERLPRAAASLAFTATGFAAIALFACGDDDSNATPAPSQIDSGSFDGSKPAEDASTAEGGDPNDGFTAAEIATLRTMSPLPALPKDPTNKYAEDPKAAKLGQMLFFDKSYSGPIVAANDGTNGGLGAVGETGKVSCASCHSGSALIDDRSKPGNVSIAIDFGTRNALAIVNSSFNPWTNWGGRFDSQWSLPPAVAENPRNMASSRLALAHTIFNKYKAEYEETFGALDPALNPAAVDAARFPAAGKPKAAAADPDGAWELMAPADRTIVNTIFANFGKAIQAYMRLVVSRNAAFDRYIAGSRDALSDSAKRGARIFIGKGGCVGCHAGPTFSDGQFHALGVTQTGPHVPATDLGRFTDVAPLLVSPFNTNGDFSDDKTTGKLTGLTQTDVQRGQFRTPSLRNVAQGAPFFHTGEKTTLAEVIAFYNAGGGDVGDAGITKDVRMKPLGLTPTESADLVAFLESLSGEAVSAALTQNTAK